VASRPVFIPPTPWGTLDDQRYSSLVPRHLSLSFFAFVQLIDGQPSSLNVVRLACKAEPIMLVYTQAIQRVMINKEDERTRPNGQTARKRYTRLK
jgi:hypothetical protein